MSPMVVQRENEHFDQAMRNNAVSPLESNEDNPTVMSRQRFRRRQQHFALSLRLLSVHLSKTHPALHKQLKAAVHHCAQRSKAGAPHSRPVSKAIKRCILKLVGNGLWEQCKNYTDIYMDQQNLTQDEPTREQGEDDTGQGA
jgi:hypothetical protein